MNQNLKKKKFRPKKTPRYLIGQVDKITAMNDLKTYNGHKFRIHTAVPYIDNSPPKMNPYMFLKIPNLLADAHRLKQIDTDNKKIIQRINIINRTKGSIDSYNPAAYANCSKWAMHCSNMIAIYKHNQNIYKLIKEAESNYSRASHNAFWQIVLDKIKHSAKFPLVALYKDNVDKIIAKMPSLTNCNIHFKNPKCFMDFQIKNGPYLGQIIIELYESFVPVTVQNFIALCKGYQSLCYLLSHVHKIVPGKYIELGDITRCSGRGGKSIFGDAFAEENYMLKHTRPGVLSMIRVGNKENNSMFSITYAANPDLDGKRVAFGKVIRGMDVIFDMEGMSRKFGKPMPIIYISNCGEYVKQPTKKIE